MNLQPLFEKQAELDQHIEQEHPRQLGENRLSKKILALQVELGELANEWRGFKFWSKRQFPTNQEVRNTLLEEYVDGLHFILSIGLELNIDDYEVLDHIELEPYFRNTIYEQFDAVFYFASRAISKYKTLFNAYIGLGKWLGFEWQEVLNAYDAKNATNHERQETGY